MIKPQIIQTAFGVTLAITLLSGALIPAFAEPSSPNPPFNGESANKEVGGTPEDKADAVKAMEAWLALNDEGKYEAAWNQAAPSFKTAVTAAQWSHAATQARSPLGKLIARKLASAFYTSTKTDGYPPVRGLIVVAQFKTEFANLYSAIETVTFEKGVDNIWRAAGYYIKPAT